jgi:hypothetical protein
MAPVRESLSSSSTPGEFKSAARRFNLKTLAFLRFESLGGCDAVSGAPTPTVFPPL